MSRWKDALRTKWLKQEVTSPSFYEEVRASDRKMPRWFFLNFKLFAAVFFPSNEMPLKMAGSKGLFACTKCHSRHPFEDLSKDNHLCKVTFLILVMQLTVLVWEKLATYYINQIKNYSFHGVPRFIHHFIYDSPSKLAS